MRIFCSLSLLLLIASPLFAQEAEEQVVMRTYSLTHLTPVMANPPLPLDSLIPRTGGLPGLGETDEEAVVDRMPGGSDLCEAVMDLLRMADEFASIEAVRSDLVMVIAKESGHRAIERILAALAQPASKPLRIEVRCLTIAGAQRDESLWRTLATARSVDEKSVAALMEMDEERGARVGEVVATPGAWAAFQLERQTRYLLDFDVEIAQGMAIADPVMATVREGVSLGLRPFLLQDGQVVAHLVARTGKLEMPLRRFRCGASDLGELEQADLGGAFVSTELLLRPGAFVPVVLGSPRGPRTTVLLFRLIASPEAAPDSSIRILPAGALCARDAPWVIAHRAEDGVIGLALADCEARMSLDRQHEVLHDRAGLEAATSMEIPWLHGGAILIWGEKAIAASAAGVLAQIETESLMPLRLLMRLQSVPAQSAGRPSGPAGERAPSDAILSLPCALGRPTTFGAYRTRDYVADYDVEVAENARIADPIIGTALGGVLGSVSVGRLGPRMYRAKIELHCAGLADAIRELNHDTREVGTIQEIATRKTHLATAVDLEMGGSARIEMGADPFDPTGTSRLVLLVTLVTG